MGPLGWYTRGMRTILLIAAIALFARPATAEPVARAHRVIHVSSSITVLEVQGFAEGHVSVPPSLIPVLNAVASTLRANPDLRMIEIQGFADDRGSAWRNVALSLLRAKIVRDYLIAHGVQHGRLRIAGFGKTAEPKRAVEFVIVAHR